MSGVVLVRPVLAVVAGTITLLGLAGPADAAKPARESVTITAPTDGSTGTVTNVRVTGTAKGADTVRVTVSDDPNTYESPVTRGSWAVFTNPVMAGINQICAEAFSSGISVARTCITYYVEPDGQALSLYPDGSYPVQSTFLASGGCDGNSTLRLTLDGSAILVPCTAYYFEHRYEDVPEGEHTLTVDQLALDGTTVVASITHTITSLPTAAATVEITDPADGASGDSTTLTVTGTETSNVDDLVRVYVDGVFTDSMHSSDGQWTSTLTLDWGTHEICAEKSDSLANPIARDCITYTVALSDTSLTITSPADGSAVQAFATAEGTCVGELYVDLTVDDGGTERLQCFDGRWAENLFLADGPHTLTVSMSAGGQTVTDTTSFTADSTPPPAVVVTSPASGSTLTSVPVTLTGTSEPGSTVTLYDIHAEPYRTTTTSESGTWSITLDRDFFQIAGVLTGRRSSVTFGLDATDSAGNRAESTTVTYTTRLR